MTHDQHHEHLIAEVEELYKPILSKSPQAIYIYLDDEHKTCNKKFSSLLGYKSVKEWVDNEYPLADRPVDSPAIDLQRIGRLDLGQDELPAILSIDRPRHTQSGLIRRVKQLGNVVGALLLYK